MMNLIVVVIIAVLLAGCGSQGMPPYDSLTSMQPRVIAVTPADGEIVSPETSVSVEFSRSIDPSTVDNTTLAIVKTEAAEADLDGLAEDIDDGDVVGIEGFYEFQESSHIAVFRGSKPLEKGSTYVIVATDHIMSTDLFPLNQKPGTTPAPFVSSFIVMGEEGDMEGTGSASENEEEGAKEGEAEIMRVRPSYLIINELLYDAVGSDTEGDVFIELAGEAGGDITGYKLIFINGEDGVITSTIEMPENALIGDDGIYVIADAKTGSPDASDVGDADFIKNFDPQNGPDCVQLLDDKGGLLDALAYGEPIAELAENGMRCFEGTLATDVSSGQSLSRSGGLDSDDNAIDFIALDSPTPGVL
jgi:hypothetical protein